MDERRLDGHKKTLGIIYIVSAALTSLAMISLKAILVIVLAFASDHASGEEERIIDFVSSLSTVIGGFLFVLGVVPELIAGIGLVTRQSWGMTFGLIVGGINLFFFPIGTAIGVYAIWIYAEDQRYKKVPQPQ